MPQSLDKELQQITASSATKKRFADKLYKVWLLDGQEVLFYILNPGNDLHHVLQILKSLAQIAALIGGDRVE
jgi:hypothetical protein